MFATLSGGIQPSGRPSRNRVSVRPRYAATVKVTVLGLIAAWAGPYRLGGHCAMAEGVRRLDADHDRLVPAEAVIHRRNQRQPGVVGTDTRRSEELWLRRS